MRRGNHCYYQRMARPDYPLHRLFQIMLAGRAQKNWFVFLRRKEEGGSFRLWIFPAAGPSAFLEYLAFYQHHRFNMEEHSSQLIAMSWRCFIQQETSGIRMTKYPAINSMQKSMFYQETLPQLAHVIHQCRKYRAVSCGRVSGVPDTLNGVLSWGQPSPFWSEANPAINRQHKTKNGVIDTPELFLCEQFCRSIK